jgi:hypothetical protein
VRGVEDSLPLGRVRPAPLVGSRRRWSRHRNLVRCLSRRV